jgi:hypothetical protein
MLEADLAQNGEDVVEHLRKERPYDYLRIAVSLLPNEVPARRIEDMTDNELAILLRALAQQETAQPRPEPAKPDGQCRLGVPASCATGCEAISMLPQNRADTDLLASAGSMA